MTRNQETTSITSPFLGVTGAKYSQSDSSKNQNLVRTIMIEKGKLRIRIPVQNILFVKAEHVYCRIYFFNDQRVLKRISLDKLMTKLPEDMFLRVHRSFMVNVNHVGKFNSSKIQIGEAVIPIGRTWKASVLPRLQKANSYKM